MFALRRPLQLVPTKTPRRKTAMKTRAAVALEKGKPLTVTEVELDGPKASEVLVEVNTLSGADPEGLFPPSLGHEGAGIDELIQHVAEPWPMQAALHASD